MMTLHWLVVQAAAQELKRCLHVGTLGWELRQNSSGWVQPRPSIAVEPDWRWNQALSNMEAVVLLPWTELAPGARIGHMAGRLSWFVGWAPDEPTLAMEFAIGPSASLYTSRWTAPIDHFAMVASPGLRYRFTFGPRDSRLRVSLGGGWRTDGLDLSVQVGR